MTTLDEWRRRADPLADEAVAALDRRGGRGDPWSRAVDAAAQGDRAVLALFDAVHEPPAWVDFARMEAGRRAFHRNAPFTILVLVAGSLVESFAAAKAARVLRATGRLEREPLPRVYETASFVRDALTPGGVEPGGAGHQAAVRVRLLHAYARRYVEARADHDVARDGAAINQEDMAHTLTLFSHVVSRGVARLGGDLTREERESYTHLWRWLGFVLGVDEALLPRGCDEEQDLYHRIAARHYHPGEDSRVLTRAVLDAVAGQPPFFLPRPALTAVCRVLVGQPLADALHLPRAAGWAGAVRAAGSAARRTTRLARWAPGTDRLLTRLGGAFIEANRAHVFAGMPLPDYGFRTRSG